MRTFYFNTGVKPWNHGEPKEGESYINNELHISFECEDVPDGSVFKFASGNIIERNYIMRDILNSKLCSKYAYFTVPEEIENYNKWMVEKHTPDFPVEE